MKAQLIVAGEIAAAALFSVAWVSVGLAYVSPPDIATEPGSRLAFAFRWEILVGLMPVLGVAAVAHQRFLTPDRIDGSRAEAGTPLDINARYLQNTAEQSLIAVIAHASLVLVVPADQLQIIPILVLLFVFARVCFWIGYHLSPLARGFGFASTFLPTAFVYGYVIWVQWLKT